MQQKIKKKITACIAGIVACVVLIAALACSVVVLNTSNVRIGNNDIRSTLYSKVIIAALPHSITGDDNGKKITFYMDYNKDYDKDKDEPLRQFLPYYMKGKKRVDLPTGVYISPTTGEQMQVTIGFFLKGGNKIKVVATALKVLIALFVLAIIITIIVLSYFLWSLKQDKKDAMQYDIIKNRFDKKEKEEN